MRGLAVAAALLLASPAFAAEIESEVAVAAATLYPQGASVERRANFDAEAGRHTVLLIGMPARFRRESLRVTGEGDFRILSIDERTAATRALEARRRSPARDLREAIRTLQDRRIFAQNAIQAADRQLAFIEAMTGAQAKASAQAEAPALVDAEQWSGMWASVGEGVREALDTRNTARIEMREIDEQIAELNAQLRDAGRERSLGPVLAVEIEADGPVEGALTVKYQMDGASWYPVYDARLMTGDDASMTLVRRAQVAQSTGEDWTGIDLTLSTARPSGRAAAPDPRALFARIQEEREELALSRQRGVAADMAYEAAPMPVPQLAPAPVMVPGPERAVMATTVAAIAQLQGETVEYVIPGTVDVAGSGEGKQVLIDEREAEAALEVRATPSLDETAYLYAEFENADEAPILPGTASLYRDDVFVGTAPLARVAGGETTFVPFGSYDSIKIAHREIERIEGESGIIRARQTERRRYEMSAENFGDRALPVVLRDSMPYAENEDVEITLRADPQPDERDGDDIKGALAWRFMLEPGSKETVEHGYDVTYPTGVRLLLPR